jgi:aminoglycoside phosphotransferase (APT) family kinase protein
LQIIAGKSMAAMPHSLCHGDLSRSNILVSGAQFTIIDWEFSQAAPAAVDAIRLATQFPGFAETYIKELRHLDARAWFVLGCVHAANAHAERLHGLAVNRHQHMAARKTARKLAEIIALADHHAIVKT